MGWRIWVSYNNTYSCSYGFTLPHTSTATLHIEPLDKPAATTINYESDGRRYYGPKYSVN
jgi:hypothetical protein